MKKATIANIESPISALAIGTSFLGSYDAAAPLYDAYLDAGGNFFDTAHVYGLAFGEGCCEKALGEWIFRRGDRELFVILAKGAHPPDCFPGAVATQLDQTLDRLQTSYVDLYMLHNDNPDVPVEEFVDAMEEQRSSGKVRAYGVSNWTIPRIEAAQSYAERNVLPGIAAVSNNLSLAEMIRPVHPGSVSVSDSESLAWFKRSQVPLVPWSSQGRGVFTALNDPRDLQTHDLGRYWYSPENVERIQRARVLAASKSVRAVNVALAYVLAQPFPTYPIIGPRTISELESSLVALELSLTSEEREWLNLQTSAVAMEG